MQLYTCGVICNSKNERRNALINVWMTRTRSALYRNFSGLLSLRPATLS
jgi:hypothetical protein